MSLILMTTLFYKALPLQGEIWCWSLLGIKGLNTSKCETCFDQPTAMACFEESDKHCYWYLLIIIITFRLLSYNQDSDCNQTFFVCKMQQSIFLMWTSKEKWRKLNPSLMQISAECHIIMVVLHPLLWDWGKGAKCDCSYIFRIFWIPADVWRSCLLTKTRVFPFASKKLYEKMYQRP